MDSEREVRSEEQRPDVTRRALVDGWRSGSARVQRTGSVRAVEADRALSGSRRAGARSGVRQVPARHRGGRAARHRRALERRSGVDRRRTLPAVERHPEQRHHALGRDQRHGHRIPQARRLLERSHARSPGPPDRLRARAAPRHAHRARRPDQRARRPLRGQAAQLAERRRREVRRLDLVHRSAVRHRRDLRRLSGEARAAAKPLSAGSERPADRRRRRSSRAERPVLLARREAALRRRGARDAEPPDPRVRRRRCARDATAAR